MVHTYMPILLMYCGINMSMPLPESPASVTDHGSWYYFPEGWCIVFCSVLTSCLSCVTVLHSTQNLLWTQNDFFKIWTVLPHSLLSSASESLMTLYSETPLWHENFICKGSWCAWEIKFTQYPLGTTTA